MAFSGNKTETINEQTFKINRLKCYNYVFMQIIQKKGLLKIYTGICFK